MCRSVEVIIRRFDGLKVLKVFYRVEGVTKGTKLFSTVILKMFITLNAAYQGHNHIVTSLLGDCSNGSLQVNAL